MIRKVYAQGRYRSGQPFLLEFETKRDAKLWAGQHDAVVTRTWAVYTSADPRLDDGYWRRHA